jgi:Helix-turn-helix domain
MDTNPANHRRFSVREAATYLGLSKSTLDKLRLTGGGPAYLKLLSRVLYDVRDLDSWADRRRRSNTSETM